MNKTKRTKIVCTIGPASWAPEVLTEMIDAGMNVARINGAFADIAELERVEKLIRGISEDVALMLDIKGTEVRLNRFGDPIELNIGDTLEIGNSEEHKIFPITYPNLHQDLEVGARLLFNDGKVEAVLKEKRDGVMVCEVVRPGKFLEGKSINTPGALLSNPPLTDRDREQMDYVKSAGWEFVAASFIRNRMDAELVAEVIKGSDTRLIAKIEDQHGVDNINDILEVVDGVMIARGDMGVELPFEKIPMIQKDLIFRCNMVGKPVIVATQMLESMVENDRPTRAEITDVANAIIDGTDAIMLSAESSAGKFPVEAVKTMTKIAVEVEGDIAPGMAVPFSTGDTIADALTRAAYQVIEDLGDDIKAVVSVSGRISRVLSTYGLDQPVYPFIENNVYRRQLVSLTSGIQDSFVLGKTYSDRDEAVKDLISVLKENDKVDVGDKVLIIGYALSTTGDFPNIFEVVTV